jgi:hypothetical protein
VRVAASASALTVARQGRGFGPSSRQYFRTSDYLAQQLGEGHRGVVFVERADRLSGQSRPNAPESGSSRQLAVGSSSTDTQAPAWPRLQRKPP